MPKHRRMKYSQSFLQLLCSCLSLLGKVIKIQQSNLYVTSNFRLWLTILKMGSITFFGGCSHWNRDRSNILFRCTDFNLALAIGHLSCRVLNYFQRPYLLVGTTSGHLFLHPRHEVGKSSSFSFSKQRKSLPSDVSIL